MTTDPRRLPGGASAPPVLLDYQKRWIADPAPLKVIEKSRRTGITWAEAADDVLTAASSRAAGGQNVYYIAYNQDMTIEYVQACAMWARAFDRAASDMPEGFWEGDEADKHIKTFTIHFPATGFRVVALTSRPSNLRGRQGTIVIDEAAFHDQLDELLKAALAMLIWGGRVRVISTHNGVDNPFNELVNDVRAGNRRGATLHRITFQEAVAAGLYRRVCLRLGKDWDEEGEADWMAGIYDFYGAGATEELDCIPAHSGGAWLSRALIESRMSKDTPVLRWECKEGFELLPDHLRAAECRDWLEAHLLPRLAAIPPSARSFVGGDFGRSGDLSVDVPLIEGNDLVRHCPFTVELRNVPFRQQEQIAFYLIDRLPRFLGGAFDARGNGQYLAEVCLQRYGASRIQPVMLSEGWYREHMPPVKAALEDGTLVDLPSDADVLDDLRAVQVIKGVPRIPDTRTTGNDQGRRHGDAAVAIALAYFASRELDKGPVTVKSRRPRTGARLTEGFL
jgi:phage FluMu gp28-like protein